MILFLLRALNVKFLKLAVVNIRRTLVRPVKARFA